MAIHIMNHNKLSGIILKMLLLTLVCASISGCRDDLLAQQDAEVTPAGAYSVSIALAGMGQGETRSFGTRSDATNESDGNEEESFIDIEDLYVMTFSIEDGKSELSDESKLLEVLWNGSQKGKPTGTGIHYNGTTAYLRTWLSKEIEEYKPNPGRDFCIVALANFHQFAKTDGQEIKLEKGLTFGTLRSGMQFNFTPNTSETKEGVEEWMWLPYHQDEGVKTKKGIPLFGVKRVNLKYYDKEIHNFANPYSLISNGSPTVWMLRAFAKVVINLDEELRDLVDNGVKVEPSIISAGLGNNYSGTFRLAPALNTMQGFTDTGETGQVISAPDFIGVSGASAGNNLTFVVSEDGQSAYTYIPEYQLSGKTTNISLKVKVKNVEKDYSFVFKEYPSAGTAALGGTCWNYVLRNHTYQFNVTFDFKIVTVIREDWGDAFDNEYVFG